MKSAVFLSAVVSISCITMFGADMQFIFELYDSASSERGVAFLVMGVLSMVLLTNLVTLSSREGFRGFAVTDSGKHELKVGAKYERSEEVVPIDSGKLIVPLRRCQIREGERIGPWRCYEMDNIPPLVFVRTDKTGRNMYSDVSGEGDEVGEVGS